MQVSAARSFDPTSIPFTAPKKSLVRGRRRFGGTTPRSIDVARTTRVSAARGYPPHPWKPPARHLRHDTRPRRPGGPSRGRVTRFSAPPFFVPPRGRSPPFSSHALTSPPSPSHDPSLHGHGGQRDGMLLQPRRHALPVSEPVQAQDRRVGRPRGVAGMLHGEVQAPALDHASALARRPPRRPRRPTRRARRRHPAQVRQQNARRAELRVQALSRFVHHGAMRQGALRSASAG